MRTQNLLKILMMTPTIASPYNIPYDLSLKQKATTINILKIAQRDSIFGAVVAHGTRSTLQGT